MMLDDVPSFIILAKVHFIPLVYKIIDDNDILMNSNN